MPIHHTPDGTFPPFARHGHTVKARPAGGAP